ncbi:hypothetical protein AVEN_193978-1 [Araneus ventricosus]|uniref:Uncharacterized protein n=1 Tax=Araneus ventricosus TaxID=182803 RepID=A0A4Y2W2X9_ARAVE|nr:hypothetical protein AVEN_193978-1 [Araneus ventricosus]
MACVNSLKSIWEKTDSSYIQATKPGVRTPVIRRLFPQVSSERNQPDKELQRAEDECENASENGSNHEALGYFDAIPEEFRPSKQGKDLMKVKASSKKEDSKDKVSAGQPPENQRFPNKPNVPRTKRGTRNSNSSAIQNEVRNYEKELLKSEESELQRDIGMISDETGKQKKSNGMFFYTYSSQNDSTSKASNGCQQNLSGRENSRESSEKSKLRNAQDENHFRGFYDSESNQSKATDDFDMHSSFEKLKEETNFNKFNKNMPPKFQDRNATNQNRDKDETNFPKHNKNMPPKFQDRTGSNQNRASFADKGAQKITREVTVEKRIKWKNDLCELKKPENKPNYFYEYTKTTKESVSYVPSHSEDDNDDEGTKTPYQDLKKGRDFCNNFRRTDFGHYKQRPQNQKGKGFDSTCKAQRNEANHFSRDRPQKPANKFEEKRNFFQCGNGKDPIIIRHEIKVIHVNQQGKNNRMFHHSSQTFRPYRGRNGKIINNDPRERNGKMINTDTRERSGKIINNGPRERNGEMNNADSRERNGKMVNTDTREYCGVKIEENTMTKTVDGFQKTRKNYVRIPLKLSGSSSNTENAHNNVSRTSNSENGAALIKYGRDISDMIAGSYVAISTFLDNYEQWKDFRRVTMLLFEEVEKNLSQSCHRNKRIIEVAALVGTGCKMVQYVPHVGVSVAAKVIAVLSDIVARIFSSSNSAKIIGMDDFQLKLSLQRDMEATSDIYMYGMQCDINFHETCQLIEEFHREIQDGRFKEFEETFETGFLKEISLLNPKLPAVFYKKLGRFYKLLNDRQQSEDGKAFCGAFEDWPDALTTISRLYRRFKTENWDSSSVMKAWEEVYNLLQNDQSVVEDVLKKIQNCIFVLMREQSVMERYVMDLQRQC